ncbi:cell filamentation protein Fic [Gammaproteobacteria bacterium 50_400_T64]|nr:cell filamentation protein Fic [Gammaproteobacteria bacterium 50_400_T64]
MTCSILNVAPFIPSDKALAHSSLPDLAMTLSQKSAKLSGQLAEQTRLTLETYMRVINSYYSNLIEGNATQPHEIRAAQRGDYNTDAAKRDLQQESLGHMAVQAWLQAQSPDAMKVFSPAFIQEIHRQFYLNIPESLWVLKDEQGAVVGKVVPGEWRTQPVAVGLHIPPAAKDVEALMTRFCETYQPARFSGDRKLIAIMAAHHRLAWIHPFLDGNGRVGRLATDAALKATGLDSYGAWCLSRGLARGNNNYKTALALADQPRQGDYDGRGQLSEKGLLEFCRYMLDTAIDQVDYLSELLDLAGLRKRIDGYVRARNDFRVRGMDKPLKPVAGLILHTAFIYGEIDRAQALELCGMPERSARRLLSQLKTEGLLSETSSKSPLRWAIPEHAEPWYFPDLAPQI